MKSLLDHLIKCLVSLWLVIFSMNVTIQKTLQDVLVGGVGPQTRFDGLKLLMFEDDRVSISEAP